MKTKDINDMSLSELEKELMIVNVVGDNAKAQRIRRKIRTARQDVAQCLEQWPKAKNFRIAMKLLITEGKFEPVIKNSRMTYEVDMAQVILKLYDMTCETVNNKAHTLPQIINEYESLLLQDYQERELEYVEYRDGNQ